MPSVAAPPPVAALDEDSIDDLLYFSRSGDLDSLRSVVTELSQLYNANALSVVAAAVDDITGNTSAHYAAANGHIDILEYLATSGPLQASSFLLSRVNSAGNTPLHYAALNGQLAVAKFLVNHVSVDARTEFISAKNTAGHDAAFEAEGNGKDEVVSFLLGVMDEADAPTESVVEEHGTEGQGEDVQAAEYEKTETEPTDEEAILGLQQPQNN